MQSKIIFKFLNLEQKNYIYLQVTYGIIS